MIGTIYLLVLLVSLLIMFFGFKYIDEGLFIINIYILPVLLVGLLLSLLAHNIDKGVVAYGDEYIQNRVERVEGLNMALNAITSKTTNTALMNKDAPVTTLMSEIAKAEKSLEDMKWTVTKAKRSIYSRKLGPFSSVTWFDPEVK